MSNGGEDIGLFRRAVVMMLGLSMASNNFRNPVVHVILGLVGVLIFLAALGVIELAMAVWYWTVRRRLLARRAGRGR